MAQEFLPFCDVLFNIISLAAYFCDVVFDLLLVYTLYMEGRVVWFATALAFILLSLLVSQITSLKWYLLRKDFREVSLVLTVHMLQSGILWRYFRLFIPVELSQVKQEVRDLCLLRLLHAFCQAAPMLLLQLYLIWERAGFVAITDLHIVSALLSLFNVCWALASFSKNVRRRNIHRLVLTWLGVICQLFWRLGTVSSRVVALTAYATLYHSWVLAVIALHWLTMFLWLISPKNVFHGEAMYWHKKVGFSALIAFVYIFCYINLQEVNARPKMVAFYLIMFLENSLLVGVWLGLRLEHRWFHYPAVYVVVGGFFLGLAFMFLYYRFFHIRLLNHSFYLPDNFYPIVANGSYPKDENMVENGSSSAYKSKSSAMFPSLAMAMYSNRVSGRPGGVFNCRLNPVLKRKKKKPSSFIPPPKTILPAGVNHPFWKKLPATCGSSDHESSVGSRVNIQQKLQEKKQQQLQELKEIQEEMKQGKLKPLDMSEKGTLKQQPIPSTKKRPWLKLDAPHYGDGYHPLRPLVENNSTATTAARLRSQTPEILLAPESYDTSYRYYAYQELARGLYTSCQQAVAVASDHSSYSEDTSQGGNGIKTRGGKPRLTSDIDSQISLPRSYTLPREFKYHRKGRSRRHPRRPTPSNNSSDGDVDSAEEERPRVHLPPRPYLLPGPGFKRSATLSFPETQL